MGQTYTNDGPRVNMVNSKLWRLSFSCSNLIVVKQIQMLIRMKIIICLDMIILSYVQHPPYLNKVKKVQCLEPLFRASRENFFAGRGSFSRKIDDGCSYCQIFNGEHGHTGSLLE